MQASKNKYTSYIYVGDFIFGYGSIINLFLTKDWPYKIYNDIDFGIECLTNKIRNSRICGLEENWIEFLRD